MIIIFKCRDLILELSVMSMSTAGGCEHIMVCSRVRQYIRILKWLADTFNSHVNLVVIERATNDMEKPVDSISTFLVDEYMSSMDVRYTL